MRLEPFLAGKVPILHKPISKARKTRFVFQHIEKKLCKLLCCTPNDLFTWTPDTKADDYPENPLQALRKKPSFDLAEKLKGMSLEEIKRRLG